MIPGFDDHLYGAERPDSGSSTDGMNAVRNAMAIHRESVKGQLRHPLRLGTGAALILTALLCICLLCFASLTLVSAQADRRLTQQYEDLTAEYYEAYGAGQAFLADLVQPLGAVRSEADPEAAASSDDALQMFTQEISDTQTYLLIVHIQYPEEEAEDETVYYQILFSGSVTTASYDYDTTLNVITK